MRKSKRIDGWGIALLVVGVLAIAGGVGLWSRQANGGGPRGDGAAAFLHEALVRDRAASPGAALPPVRVLRTATCGCCSAWVDHLREDGFDVDVEEVAPDRLRAAKDELGIAERHRSCHTAAAGGYLFEGHVPADLIRRVIDERPAIEGLAVPGMPVGSPGMEGAYEESYEVLALLPDGGSRVYATR